MPTMTQTVARGLEELRNVDCRHVWHPYTTMETYRGIPPVIIERAEGVWLYDVEGKRYLDGVASLWANVHGHTVREIDEAIIEQVAKVSHTTLFGLSHPKSIELAERLIGVLPRGLSRIQYSESGSAAVETALSVAYLYWHQKSRAARKKRRFISLGFGYHGDTNGVKSLGAPHDVNRRIFGDMLYPSLQMPSPYCGRCESELEPATCGRRCLERVDKAFQAHADEIAAIIVEPLVQGAGGIRVAFEGYLREVRALCDRHDVLLIADEVATGFGKTGTLFACEQEGVSPDILCMAKGLTGGYLPLAATAVTEEIYRVFSGDYPGLKMFPHGHTYSGNPLACAAAVASLGLFRSNGVIENLQPKIRYLSKLLERFKGMEHVGTIRQKGVMVGIELVRNRDTGEAYPNVGETGARAARAALKKGLYIRQLGDVIVWMPPLVISEEAMDFLAGVTRESIEEATREAAPANA